MVLVPVSQPISSIVLNDNLHYFDIEQVTSAVFLKIGGADFEGTVRFIPCLRSYNEFLN
jgi:hypothetical protein